ncbi:hypothetical protein BVRB_018970 [Beta vulgaris subsp. vulgaris]|uniref:Uncharacterized protein n=1 Tax=Beta vulgaris subsp. vulgaris TaxID=3555 RepID=A0A0J7YN63_BETVV|nr:hypothetical protein BVRB_018970 [Beta vulgaris subsp. vulgaris]
MMQKLNFEGEKAKEIKGRVRKKTLRGYGDGGPVDGG